MHLRGTHTGLAQKLKTDAGVFGSRSNGSSLTLGVKISKSSSKEPVIHGITAECFFEGAATGAI